MVALIKGRAADVVDTALDLGILPGFSAIGYRARKRLFGWDADRLDLGRVGKRPHPKYLSEHAHPLIEGAYEWSVT